MPNAKSHIDQMAKVVPKDLVLIYFQQPVDKALCSPGSETLSSLWDDFWSLEHRISALHHKDCSVSGPAGWRGAPGPHPFGLISLNESLVNSTLALELHSL